MPTGFYYRSGLVLCVRVQGQLLVCLAVMALTGKVRSTSKAQHRNNGRRCLMVASLGLAPAHAKRPGGYRRRRRRRRRRKEHFLSKNSYFKHPINLPTTE